MITNVYGNSEFLHTIMLIKNYLMIAIVIILLASIMILIVYYHNSMKRNNNNKIYKLRVNILQEMMLGLITLIIPASIFLAGKYVKVDVINNNAENNTKIVFAKSVTAKRQIELDEFFEGKQTGSFNTRIADLNCYLHVPENVEKDLPLVIFLHGIGEHNVEQIKKVKPVKAVTDGTLEGVDDFIFVAPAAPNQSSWLYSSTWSKIIDLINEIKNEYGINDQRVYITGFSAGANAVWGIINKYPDAFRAAVPVSGYNKITPKNLINIPIYAIVGENEIGYKNAMKKLVNDVNNAGGNASLNIIPNAYHRNAQLNYSTKELYNWLLSQ